MKRPTRTNPTRIQRAERVYSRQLRNLARHIGHVVSGFDYEDGSAVSTVTAMLRQYAQALTPWARVTAEKMIREVNQRDLEGWRRHSLQISEALRREIINAPTGETLRALLESQVTLITSLPIEAANRVHELTLKGLETSSRATEVAREIMRTGEVTESRALLIARTETSRTASTLVQARSMYVGSEQYIWRTSGDGDVREDHEKLNGRAFKWTSPPIADKRTGARSHPGMIYNCFTGETKVRLCSGIRKIIRAFHDGKIVDVRTPFSLVSATPNHPMLTKRGWVPVGEVNKGDYFLKPLSYAVGVVEANEDVVFSTFDDLFLSFGKMGETTSGVHFDFYGDIFKGDVDIAPIERSLPFDRVPHPDESVGYLNFPRSDRVMGGVDLHGEHVGNSSARRECLPLLEGKLAHPDQIGIASRSNINAVLDKPFCDGDPRYSNCFREFECAYPGVVEVYEFGDVNVLPVMRWSSELALAGVHPSFSEFYAEMVGADHPNSGGAILEKLAFCHEGLCVVDTGTRDFFGHVFTLETNKGWYGVGRDSVISKNCRCYPEPIIPE